MTPLCAVLDLGKTRWKAYTVSAQGRQSRVREQPARSSESRWYPALDTEAAWCFVLDALAGLMAERPFDRVLPVTHGAAAALLDGDALAMPVMDYETDLPAACSAEYDALRPDFAETGSPPLPRALNLGRQLFVQQRAAPDAFGRARLLTYPQYWALRLGGEAATDVSSLGCHSDLWAPAAGTYSSLAVTQGWAGRFPPLRRTGTPVGRLDPAIARRIGATHPVAVLCGGHDSNVALAGLAGAGAQALVSSGTWSIAFAPGRRAGRVDPRRDMLLNVDVDGRIVPSARCMTGRERQTVDPDGILPTLDEAVEVAERSCFALPSFTGSGRFAALPGEIRPAMPEPRLRPALASLACGALIHEMLTALDIRGTVALDGPAAADPVVLAMLRALAPERQVVAPSGSLLAAGAARLAFGTAGFARPPARLPSSGQDALLRCYGAQWRAWALAREARAASPGAVR